MKWSDKIEYIVGCKTDFANITENRPLVPFSQNTVDFLAALSGKLRSSGALGKMPDAAAFAFWCRRAHLEKLKEAYVSSEKKRVGRGVSLWFAPSNMPVLFAFSMAAGLLAGNSVIVRLPGKETGQERLIAQILRELLQTDFPQFIGRIVLCRYGHERDVTDVLSALCDVRVIWGSDTSVQEIRKSPLAPRAIDLPFASRSSMAVLSADKVCAAEDLDTLIRGFYNDTYLNDQNACSSPRIIFWVGDGETVAAAKQRFWTALEQFLKENSYEVSPSTAVRKLDGAFLTAAKFEHVQIRRHGNWIVRASVPEPAGSMWDCTVPGGFFLECEGKTIDGAANCLTKHCQTVCTFGIEPENLVSMVIEKGLPGADRIVPVGHALDFSLVWDGIDLIESMSRRIHVLIREHI